MEAAGSRETAASASSVAWGTHFLPARLTSPLFFPPVRPISAADEMFGAFAEPEALRVDFNGGELGDSASSNCRSKSACASRLTSSLR
jgi:hypothetical protein